MNKKIELCIVLSLLLLGMGCASKAVESSEESVKSVESESQIVPQEFVVPPEGAIPPEDFMGPNGMGMTRPDGANYQDGFMGQNGMKDMTTFVDRNASIGGYLSLIDDVDFYSSLDYDSFIGESNFEINEDEYQNYPILLGSDGVVGTTMMYTNLEVEVDGTNIKITNSSSDKYNVILSGSWDGGITIESKKSDIMVTLASATITAIDTPALILKGENVTYIKSDGSSLICDTSDNGKKGALTSDGDVVFFGDGDLTVNGEKKHGLKVDGTVEIEGGTLRINMGEGSEGNGISADAAFLMNGGYLYINAMGNVHGEESKGIKVNGREGENPMGWVEINGGYIEIESVGKGIIAGFKAEEDGETEDTSDDPDPILTINGGTTVIIGAGGMGLGIDCDSDNNFKYNGGTLIGIGGGNNAPMSGDRISFSFDVSGKNYVLQNEEGSVIAAFVLPFEYAQNNVVVMSEDLEKGKTYSVIVNYHHPKGCQLPGFVENCFQHY